MIGKGFAGWKMATLMYRQECLGSQMSWKWCVQAPWGMIMWLHEAVLPTPIDAMVNFGLVIGNDSSKANLLPQSYEEGFEVMTGVNLGLQLQICMCVSLGPSHPHPVTNLLTVVVSF